MFKHDISPSKEHLRESETGIRDLLGLLATGKCSNVEALTEKSLLSTCLFTWEH